LFLQNPPSIRIGGQQTKSLYQVTISANDLPKLYKASQDLEEAMKHIPSIVDATSELQVKNPELDIKINRDKITKLGISVSQMQNALGSAYSQLQISTIYAPTNQYWVILEVEPEFYKDPSMLSLLRIRSSAGGLIPINSVATIENGTGPMLVTHLGQFPSVTLSFDLAPGV